MKKMNKRGFILVETLIVTVFVVSLFLLVFNITIPSIGEYEQQISYDDINSIYNTNLYKEMLLGYGKFDYIDSHLSNNNYIDVSNCEDTNIYSNVKYCQAIQESISASDAKIFLTEYNIKKFKQEVKTNVLFDSGILSNFRDYMNTISNYETFYSEFSRNYNLVGKYRLFIVRNVKDADNSTTRKFSNIGIYTGTNNKYLMGEKVKFAPGDGSEQDFYVLKNSPTTEQYVTLISANNIENSNVCFNTAKNINVPDTVLNKLRTATNNWVNVPYLTGYEYTTPAGYKINYNGYRARLLETKDIQTALGCKENDTECFDVDEAFNVDFDKNKLSWLVSGLDDTNGYWTGLAIKNSDVDPENPPLDEAYNFAFAWAIKNGTVSAVPMSDCTNIGVRAVITVEKTNITRGQ